MSHWLILHTKRTRFCILAIPSMYLNLEKEREVDFGISFGNLLVFDVFLCVFEPFYVSLGRSCNKNNIK